MHRTPPPTGSRLRPSIQRFCAISAVLASVILAAPAAFAASPEQGEELHYRWSLGGLLGVLGSLFMPGEGDGVLRFQPVGRDRLKSELVITSEAADKGEFWEYGSEVDLSSGHSLEAWSSYRWRGKFKAERQKVDVAGVRDIAATILALRRRPPETTEPMEVWSDGKIYPVRVVPGKVHQLSVAGKDVAARQYTVEGRDVPGRRFWKGSLELWLAQDAASTPVRIAIRRSLASLRLELTQYP